MAGFIGYPLKKIAINIYTMTIIDVCAAKKLKKSYLVEFLSINAAEANIPKESDINKEKTHIEFMSDICDLGNQLTTNLLGELSKKQKPKPVIYVPTIKK